MKRFVFAVTGAVAITAIGAQACSSEGKAGVPEYRDCLYHDPRPSPFSSTHWVSIYQCAHSGFCPDGTSCLVAAPGRELVKAPRDPMCARMHEPAAGESPRRCQIDSNVEGVSTILLDQFGVPGFELQRSAPAEDNVRFSWGALPDAVVTTCALFSCAPEIRNGRIVNYERCVLFHRESIGDDRTFNLADYDYDRSRASRASYRLKVMNLLVGCWAYSETKIIRASRLVAIGGGDLPADNPFVAASCGTDGSLNGVSCELDRSLRAFGAFGTCNFGRCLPRCLDDADCNPRRNEDGGVDAGSDAEGGSDAASDAEADASAAADSSTEAEVCDPKLDAICVRRMCNQDLDWVGVCVSDEKP